MTKTELIELIGDVIVKVDELSTRFLRNDPERRPLDELRDALDAAQLRLVQEQFDENTAAFQQATASLAAINADLKRTIGDVNRVVETVANLRRFVSALDEIVGIAAPFV